MDKWKFVFLESYFLYSIFFQDIHAAIGGLSGVPTDEEAEAALDSALEEDIDQNFTVPTSNLPPNVSSQYQAAEVEDVPQRQLAMA